MFGVIRLSTAPRLCDRFPCSALCRNKVICPAGIPYYTSSLLKTAALLWAHSSTDCSVLFKAYSGWKYSIFWPKMFRRAFNSCTVTWRATECSSHLSSAEKKKPERASPTCVVEGGSSVDDGSPVGLDEPLSPRPGLSGPAAERREVEVAGEPHVGCKERGRSCCRWVCRQRRFSVNMHYMSWTIRRIRINAVSQATDALLYRIWRALRVAYIIQTTARDPEG